MTAFLRRMRCQHRRLGPLPLAQRWPNRAFNHAQTTPVPWRVVVGGAASCYDSAACGPARMSGG